MKAKLFFISVFFIVPFLALGDIGGITNSKQNLEIGGPTIKPEDGGEEVVNMTTYYQNGYLYFEFYESEGLATLVITRLESGEEQGCAFLTLQPYSYYLGGQSGTYYIEVTTAVGHQYTGTLTL